MDVTFTELTDIVSMAFYLAAFLCALKWFVFSSWN